MYSVFQPTDACQLECCRALSRRPHWMLRPLPLYNDYETPVFVLFFSVSSLKSIKLLLMKKWQNLWFLAPKKCSSSHYIRHQAGANQRGTVANPYQAQAAGGRGPWLGQLLHGAERGTLQQRQHHLSSQLRLFISKQGELFALLITSCLCHRATTKTTVRRQALSYRYLRVNPFN